MRFLINILFLLLSGCVGIPSPEPHIHVSKNEGWPEVWFLQNDHIELQLVPAIGRMTHLSARQGENLLRYDADLTGILTRPPGRWGWNNYGGDWLWPVQQSEWKRMGVQKNWPPPEAFDLNAWQAEEVMDTEGGSGVELSVTYGAPLHIEVKRRFLLSNDTPGVLKVKQTLRRTAASTVPVTLWQVSQIRAPERVIFEAPDPTDFPDGVHIIFPDKHAQGPLDLQESNHHFTWKPSTKNTSKFGNDGKWIEAVLAPYVLRLDMNESNPPGSYPDGGCSISMLHLSSAEAVEIETMSVEKLLQPGEVLENEVIYSIKILEP